MHELNEINRLMLDEQAEVVADAAATHLHNNLSNDESSEVSEEKDSNHMDIEFPSTNKKGFDHWKT